MDEYKKKPPSGGFFLLPLQICFMGLSGGFAGAAQGWIFSGEVVGIPAVARWGAAQPLAVRSVQWGGDARNRGVAWGRRVKASAQGRLQVQMPRIQALWRLSAHPLWVDSAGAVLAL